MNFELKIFLITLFVFGPLDIAAWILTFTIEPNAITPAVAIAIIIYIVGMVTLAIRIFDRKKSNE